MGIIMDNNSKDHDISKMTTIDKSINLMWQLGVEYVVPTEEMVENFDEGVYRTMVTVKQLKDFVKDLPETNEYGDDYEVWVGEENGLSNEAKGVFMLNSGDILIQKQEVELNSLMVNDAEAQQIKKTVDFTTNELKMIEYAVHSLMLTHRQQEQECRHKMQKDGSDFYRKAVEIDLVILGKLHDSVVF